jgi:hypothetical protein
MAPKATREAPWVERRPWEYHAMEAADVWKIVLGAVLGAVLALLVQWSSLTYQTRRQREARWADFQRSTLIQLRDLLLELSEARQAVVAARYQAKMETGDPYMFGPLHPAVQAVRTIGDRLNVVAAAADNLSLRMQIVFVTLHASGAAMSSSASEESEHEQQMSEAFSKATELLGDELRRLA